MKINLNLLSPIGILILLLISGCNTNGQIRKHATVEITQNFEIGKKYSYEIQRGKVDSRNPDLEKVKTSTFIEFSILAMNGEDKECSWKYGLTKVIGITPEMIDEQTKKLINIYEGIEVKFAIDKNGSIKKINNYEDCILSLEKAYKIIYENPANKQTPEQIDKILSMLKSSYATPEMMVSSYFPELNLFYNLFGETINSDSIYVSRSELLNPFGGRVLPTNVTTKTDSLTDNFIIISIDQSVPSNDLNAIMKETLMEMSKSTNRSFNENEVLKMKMSICTKFNYDRKNNLLTEVYSDKLIESNGTKQSQTLKIILKK
jgi:hypothetical protein